MHLSSPAPKQSRATANGMDEVGVFYRVLTPRCENEPGTIERWKQGKYTSSHKHVPPHWADKWSKTQSLNPDDYDLASHDGCRYTLEAREAFLRFAPLNEWDDEKYFLTGEYEGVSAFDNPQGALKYAGEGPVGDLKFFAVFEGVKLAPLMDEADMGGCRVKVRREIVQPMRKREFMQHISGGHVSQNCCGDGKSAQSRCRQSHSQT